ncbi:MAG TPA: TonB-dependent receptor plug domain-containing protein, partial [Flavobacterium sp.]
VEINGSNSNAGKDLGVFIRGGRNNQVLILIDGIPVTDASGISLSYDLRLLSVNQVESIEIMKGASSTLYGTGAATGVINITLKKAEKKNIIGDAILSVGSQTTATDVDYSIQDYNQSYSVKGGSEKINYFASLNSTETRGISEARPADNAVTFEDDRFSRVNTLVQLGITPTPQFSFDILAGYDRLKSNFDSGPFTDNTENYNASNQFRLSIAPKYKYNKGEFVINAGANTIERTIFNFSSSSIYKSRNVTNDVFNKYNLTKKLFIIGGVQMQYHDMGVESEFETIQREATKFSIIDPYFTTVFNSDTGFNLNAGGRLNIHSKYGNNYVFNVNPSYNFKGLPLKIIASYSIAYITPSLYQLFSSYGDVSLTPQKDATVEAGFDIRFLNNKLNFNTVAFYREQKNEIGFDLSTYKYFNEDGKNNIRGVEVMAAYTISDNIQFNTNYTFTQLDRATRILNPKHKVNASLDFQATTKAAFTVGYQFVSDRYIEYTEYLPPNFDPIVSSAILKDYQLINVNGRFEIIKKILNVFAAVDNILNKDFTETRGFSTRGRNFKIGLLFHFE